MPTTTPMLMFLSPLVQRHLLVAIVRHLKSLRANGIPIPAELSALVDALAATSGPQRTTVGPAAQLDQPELVSYRESARRLGVSERTIRRMVATGRLRTVPIGRRKLIPLSALVEVSA